MPLESHVRIITPKFPAEFPPNVLVQLTPDEVRLERARQLSIQLRSPTRVRGTKVEVLIGDVWAEQQD